MSAGRDLPGAYTATRRELQRLATHVPARARATHGGHFGLQVTPSGIGTPPFGPDDTVIRLAGTTLVVERRTPDGVDATATALAGRSLAEAAGAAGVDLGTPFSPGADAVPVGDPDMPMALDATSVEVLFAWYRLGARALDALLPHLAAPTAAQLWPEHFDLGLGDGATGGGLNLGASPGDSSVDEPYLYVGPWTDARPGDPAYWNAPFGAVVTRSALQQADDPETTAVDFLRRGVRLLGGT